MREHTQEENPTNVSTGERPYSCTFCPRGFIQSGDLERHKRIHTGEKPFGCLNCPKIYILSCALNYHSKTHALGKNDGI